MVERDYTRPLATLLRENTREAHDKVSIKARRLVKGELSKQDYAQYLMLLWHVYDTLERALERHAAHPILEQIYNPALLARAPALSADISHFLEVDSWQSHPLHQKLLSVEGQQLRAYVARINSLADQEDPFELLAHSYVRYMGDLSGGQTVRHVVVKAYDLDASANLGISFYSFKELKSANRAGMGEMKNTKEWFRMGVNIAGEKGGPQCKASLIDEASLAYRFSAGLFDLLDVITTEATTSSLSARVSKSWQSRTFALSQVIALIAAVSLSHFILVVGGFTGNAGYQKWIAIQRWVGTWWQSAVE